MPCGEQRDPVQQDGGRADDVRHLADTGLVVVDVTGFGDGELPLSTPSAAHVDRPATPSTCPGEGLTVIACTADSAAPPRSSLLF